MASSAWKRVVTAVALAAASAAGWQGAISAQGSVCTQRSPANLNFTVKDMNGSDVDLRSFKGQVVLLNFWATWCGPCRIEIPGFVELYNTYRSRGFVVLGLSVDDPVPTLKSFASELKMNYPVLVGLSRDDVINAFPQLGLPNTFIIGRDGRICQRHLGLALKDQIEPVIKALL